MKTIPKKYIGLIFIALLIVLPVAAVAEELDIGISFLKARKMLIQNGWRPEKAGKNIFPFPEMGKKFRHMGIVEVEGCAMDRPSCIFNYNKRGTQLRLLTWGNDIKKMRISNWTYKYSNGAKHGETENKRDEASQNRIGMPILESGMRFHVAREALIKKGWKPLDIHKTDEDKYDDMAKQILNADIIEVESCDFEEPGCVFNYKRDNTYLRLFTEGKEIDKMQVHYWRLECPFDICP